MLKNGRIRYIVKVHADTGVPSASYQTVKNAEQCCQGKLICYCWVPASLRCSFNNGSSYQVSGTIGAHWILRVAPTALSRGQERLIKWIKQNQH